MIDRGTTTEKRQLRHQSERLGILAEVFDLHFPPETHFTIDGQRPTRF